MHHASQQLDLSNSSAQCLAIGPSTTQALAEQGLSDIDYPSTHNRLALSLMPIWQQTPKRVAVFCSSAHKQRSWLHQLLKKQGHTVINITTHTAQPVTASIWQATHLQQGFDIITIHSPMSLHCFYSLSHTIPSLKRVAFA